MSELKRYFTKYIRDAVKSGYAKGSECEICASKEELEFHHYHTMSVLVNAWQLKNKLSITTAEEAFEHRDAFIAEHQFEIYEDTVTLCKKHHLKLHSIYSKNPSLATAAKQRRWVHRQREKNGLV